MRSESETHAWKGLCGFSEPGKLHFEGKTHRMGLLELQSSSLCVFAVALGTRHTPGLTPYTHPSTVNAEGFEIISATAGNPQSV